MHLVHGSAQAARVYPDPERSRPAFDSARSAPLLFVAGASRSGTSMLARMLGAHSRIMAFHELHFFGSLWDPSSEPRELDERTLGDLAATLLARQTYGLWGGRPSEVERAWGRRLAADLQGSDATQAGIFAAALRRLAQDSGKTHACEQTPRNVFYAERLLDLYPNARVLVMVRDPRAVLASQKNRWRMRGLGARHLPWSEMLRNRVNYHPITMARLWARATDEAVKLAGHPRAVVLRFEDMAADPEGTCRRLCGFIGLPFEPGMLEVPRWGSSNLPHDSDTKGVCRSVLDRWREELSRGEALLCERICHRSMQRFGYVPELLGRTRSLATLPALLAYPLHVAGVVALNPGRAWIQLRAMLRGQKPATQTVETPVAET